MTGQLSPAAQAVLTTYEKVWSQGYGSPLAAALEAVADQVVPAETAPIMMRGHELERKVQRLHTRSQLLAIAAELRAL
ncbi:hypothetical protein [Cyanobium sp. A2C-AMD]|uniref:hypothetical protein n=1 Tax=Cyanobium sp. A2C-AMD TaxID=2823695 RepID=UPI0020CFCA39|nr:hypothetical protein [Cyanobium sp. A2C-AMD]MCP9876030.1 hypothetical protein [Cyanobium sp. A2C-AMD]